MNTDFIPIIFGYIIVDVPSGLLIGYWTRGWRAQLVKDGGEGLPHAGKWIGVLERMLILTFILIGEFSSIGFLIAAKSILRFSAKTNTQQRKRSEYVLIGTLMSFLCAILVSLVLLFFIPPELLEQLRGT